MVKEIKEKYGFVYIWRDRKHNRFYIGCHWGFENDGYICSSRWMRISYRRRPQDFKRRIISRVYTNRTDLVEKEYEWLQLIPKECLGKDYYNYRNYKFSDYTHKHSDETKEKISKSGIGRIKSEETREKLRQANLGKKLSEEHKEKMRQAKLGKKLSPEHIEKARISRIGLRHSKETKIKMSNSAKNKIVSLETREKLKNRKFSKETREKISKANKGRIVSLETREKISKANKGKIISDETREKISKANTGKKRTPEQIEFNKQIKLDKKYQKINLLNSIFI